ncbi:Hsp20/alpha crystallin family protein [Candidatus Obscuribacterales bacterium]|nr:Hsp20/alpha crystallin family protein [Candidatus Obscuribacterales bacterium]MBX3136973.1 Hsp20/alpha crystallin family protein [Candidatus Obscuribacterales bacterium]MBX3149176.1 Hsp20/alpha crystallin family protein [Candidatus Obscuribacterales bacterium]
MLHHRTHREYNSRREGLHRGFRLDRDYDRYESLDRMMGYEWDQHTTYSAPETDVLELDDRFILEVSLPGVVLDDVELKVEENYMMLIAKRTPNMFEERAIYLRRELPSHYLVREFEFSEDIEAEEIEARLDRGILFISIPKVEAAVRIPVSAGSIEQHMLESTTRMHKNERKVSIK